MVYMRQRDSVGDADASFVFLLKNDVRRLLVDADAEAFEFRLDDLLIGKGLVHVQDDEDEMTRFSDGNNLTTSTFPVLCALNDTGQIEHLDIGTIILHLTGYGS